MKLKRIKVSFPNHRGESLAGALETPAEIEPKAYAVFAHCFTCTKDIAAASRICRALAGHGIAALRFDFTGLGGSEGVFGATNYSSNVDDIVAAADFLSKEYAAPKLLMGHSFGGTAVLGAAERLDSVRGVVTVASPSSPEHILHRFRSKEAEMREKGEAEVLLEGRPFVMQAQFLDDVAAASIEERIKRLGKALLVFHSPLDATVALKQAAHIYDIAMHPKSFVSLENADHLLTKREDAEYVAETTAAWFSRYAR